ncbi:MAG TPA: hypothetical protein P5228_09000 [Bacteroidales bacterium]|nr:hypothetical protein [Bacteroidales bacterium]HRZ49035.1 hypothetical protein [Bacteroidales bacterium]
MKKVFSVLLVLGVVIAMAACGNKKADEEARIADSIRVADSLAAVQATADSLAAVQAFNDSVAAAQAVADSIAAAEAAKTPAKKTTIQKVKEAGQAVKQDAANTKALRGGGTSK